MCYWLFSWSHHRWTTHIIHNHLDFACRKQETMHHQTTLGQLCSWWNGIMESSWERKNFFFHSSHHYVWEYYFCSKLMSTFSGNCKFMSCKQKPILKLGCTKFITKIICPTEDKWYMHMPHESQGSLCVHPADEGWCCIVTSYLIGWTHTQNDPWRTLLNTNLMTK